MTNLIERLKKVRKEIESLEENERVIISAIVSATGHKDLGQKTYDFEGEKITIKTGENVRLDKKKLDECWKENMPFKRAYAYTLIKKEFDDLMTHGTPAQRKLLSEIVTTSPAKVSLKIGE